MGWIAAARMQSEQYTNMVILIETRMVYQLDTKNCETLSERA